jgi:hypothetical protein
MNPTKTLILDLIDDSAADEPLACTADVAECTCPDFCERDHEND